MSRENTPTDNAVAERFMCTFKDHRVNEKTFEQATSRVPSIGPVISTVGLVIDVKDIVETSTPMGAAKTIGGRLLKKCTPPELLIAGKCVMLVGGVNN